MFLEGRRASGRITGSWGRHARGALRDLELLGCRVSVDRAVADRELAWRVRSWVPVGRWGLFRGGLFRGVLGRLALCSCGLSGELFAGGVRGGFAMRCLRGWGVSRGLLDRLPMWGLRSWRATVGAAMVFGQGGLFDEFRAAGLAAERLVRC